MEQITQYINENWMKLFMYGAGGLVFVFLIIMLLRGPNGRWRWEK
jgi:hypothetical protein